MLTYLIIIVLTVTSIEIIAIWAVNKYYMENIETLLKAQSENAANFYNGYLYNTDIKSNAGKLIENFENLNAQIQVTDINGKVLADSIHLAFGKTLECADIRQALRCKQGVFTGIDPASGERVMSVAMPLKSEDKIVGTVRFTVSLEMTQKVISNLVFYFILVGSIIILIVFLISLYLSYTITVPIKKITQLSREIARGNLSVRAEKMYNDEIGILSESINHMAGEMQKADNLKNEFISSISHELKTPLTSIKGWAVTLNDTKAEDFEIIKRGIYVIDSETDRLTDMVEDLLDFSRLESGKFPVRMEDIDVNKLLLDVFEQMRIRVKRQNIDFTINMPGKCITLRADGRRIKQVLVNILDNSLKHTPGGGQISVSADVSSNSVGSFYEITVKDNGCGIDSDELPNIKNRFYRGRNSDNKSGIGLGLSICEEIVKSHKGFFDIFSESGKGTIAVVKLPTGV